MPLERGKSKKAFSHNVATEMEHGRPQNQALAIAYSMKSKSKKKKASGGTVESGSRDMNMAKGGRAEHETGVHDIDNPRNPGRSIAGRLNEEARSIKDHAFREGTAADEHRHKLEELKSMKKPKLYAKGGMAYRNDSAVTEQRPSTQERDNDSKMVSRNSSRKDNKESGWTDRPTERQAISNNGRMVKPIKHPKMVPSNAFSTRLRDEEDDLQSTASPGPYGEQPPRRDDEEGANRQGPRVPDMEDEHSTHRRPYAKGGEIEASDEHHPLDGRYEDDLTDLPPSEDEGSANARSRNEQSPNRGDLGSGDHEEPHSIHSRMQRDNEHMSEDELNPAHGKHSPDDSETRPQEEARMEHEDSIVSAIMSRRHPEHQDSDSDIDEQMMMAEGGEITDDHSDADDIHSKHSIDADSHTSQVDLSRNADEDANEEDQLSYSALRKENYSETPGLDALDSPMDSAQHGDSEESDSEDSHDMVESIRRKMSSRRQFQQR